MARGLEAEHERQEGETALRHQRTQETLKAIRDEAVRVEAARIARSFGARLAEEDGTLAAKVRTFILDQAADSVDHRETARFPASSARRTRKSEKGPPCASRRVWSWSTERGLVASRPRQFVPLFSCRLWCRCERSICCSLVCELWS